MPRGGARPNSGPKKGSHRPQTQKAHEAIHLAFDKIGGVESLTEWARENKAAFYERVWPKIIPVQMQHSGNPDDDTPIGVIQRAIVDPKH